MRSQGVGRKRKKTTSGVVKTLRDRLDGITGSQMSLQGEVVALAAAMAGPWDSTPLSSLGTP